MGKKPQALYADSCGLTFELSRLRRLAKPAVAGRLQRRVRPHLAFRALALEAFLAGDFAAFFGRVSVKSSAC